MLFFAPIQRQCWYNRGFRHLCLAFHVKKRRGLAFHVKKLLSKDSAKGFQKIQAPFGEPLKIHKCTQGTYKGSPGALRTFNGSFENHKRVPYTGQAKNHFCSESVPCSRYVQGKLFHRGFRNRIDMGYVILKGIRSMNPIFYSCWYLYEVRTIFSR